MGRRKRYPRRHPLKSAEDLAKEFNLPKLDLKPVGEPKPKVEPASTSVWEEFFRGLRMTLKAWARGETMAPVEFYAKNPLVAAILTCIAIILAALLSKQ